MDQIQELNQCIDHCKQIKDQIDSLSESSQNKVLRSTLNESAHHLDMCLQECQFALKQIP